MPQYEVKIIICEEDERAAARIVDRFIAIYDPVKIDGPRELSQSEEIPYVEPEYPDEDDEDDEPAVYTWDSLCGGVVLQDIDFNGIGLLPEQAMKAITRKIADLLDVEVSRYKEVHVQLNGVIWCEGEFNDGDKDATFYHPTNPTLAKEFAENYAASRPVIEDAEDDDECDDEFDYGQ